MMIRTKLVRLLLLLLVIDIGPYRLLDRMELKTKKHCKGSAYAGCSRRYEILHLQSGTPRKKLTNTHVQYLR